MLSPTAAIAANRFGLGARPKDGAAIGSDPRGWLDAQFSATAKTADAPKTEQPASASVLVKFRDLRVARQAAAQFRASVAPTERGTPPKAASDGDKPPPASPGIDEQAIKEFREFVRENYIAQVNERHRRAIESDTPFVERLVHFWSNHFAISADKQLVGPICGLYEQEAIRPHVLGNFRTLLLAAERHPGMNLYLDNTTSMGASSGAAELARRRGRTLGLNENLAREILELHTLGVDGGYTQHDVTEFARVLTGWSIGGQIGQRGLPGGQRARALLGDPGKPGEFLFRPIMHEPGEKTVLGQKYKERGVAEGEQVLAHLALHPATAHHLATKLAQQFVADEPPAALVDRLAAVYVKNDGELTPVYRALIAADESWKEPLAKYKTPQDFVISSYRAMNVQPERPETLIAFLSEMGQRPYTPGSPAGWPDTAAAWDGGDALLKRIEWAGAAGRRVGDRRNALELASAVLPASADERTTASIRNAESGAQAFALLLSAPEFQRR
ncbi:MAG: DUF1800 domain-containing protein [Gammaproteobacteria bacterium]